MQGKSLLQYRLKKEAYFNVADSKNALASNTVLVAATNSEWTLTSQWHRLCWEVSLISAPPSAAGWGTADPRQGRGSVLHWRPPTQSHHMTTGHMDKCVIAKIITVWYKKIAFSWVRTVGKFEVGRLIQNRGVLQEKIYWMFSEMKQTIHTKKSYASSTMHDCINTVPTIDASTWTKSVIPR